ncbi:MAG: DUF1800 domain-containing protein [Myxococcota bacterium]
MLARFAGGGDPDLVTRVAAEGPRDWLLAQLARPPSGRLLADGATPAALAATYKRPGARQRRMDMSLGFGALLRRLSERQAVTAIESPAPVEASLVAFWFDHFNVYARKGPIAYLTADYVDRALRPHVLGPFEALLLATARHPAMLHYLDNAHSVREGLRDGRGLNENYARELLELHTLGVHGGYTQADVRATAEVLTGWNTVPDDAMVRAYRFRARAHDPGTKTILGVRYPTRPEEAGEAEGETLLRRLALHPATAQRIATKLAARFVADPPPPSLVSALAEEYTSRRGDLGAVLRALVSRPEFWAPLHRGQLVKTPLDFVVSAVRTVGGRVVDPKGLRRALHEMNMSPFLCPPPTGYERDPARWANGAGMMTRMRFARHLAAGKAGITFDLDRIVPSARPLAALTEHVLRGAAAASTVAALRDVLGGGSDDRGRRRALAVALASPQFSTF